MLEAFDFSFLQEYRISQELFATTQIMETLICKIYLNYIEDKKSLVDLLLSITNGNVDRYSINFKDIDIDIMYNEEFNDKKAVEYPDGFLYFKYILDIYQAESDYNKFRDFIDKILAKLWDQKIPSIAACDFEKDLLFGGGYKNINIPWPDNTSNKSF